MQNPITQLEELTLTNASKRFLKETAKWSFFIAILGFVLIGFMVLLAVFSGTVMSLAQQMQPGMPEGMGMILSGLYICIAILYFFPVYYLLQFSNKMKKALATKSDEMLANAFEMLKSHYKFIGVFTIITISLYLLMFVVAMLGVL